ncbi:MAG: hypothetical protein ACYC35_02135 [Pirellulales bacterium]
MKAATRRATVYIQDDLHRDLRLKAAEVERSMSDLVNDVPRRSLAEDADDLATFEERASEKSLPFEPVVKGAVEIVKIGHRRDVCR